MLITTPAENARVCRVMTNGSKVRETPPPTVLNTAAKSDRQLPPAPQLRTGRPQGGAAARAPGGTKAVQPRELRLKRAEIMPPAFQRAGVVLALSLVHHLARRVEQQHE